MKQYLFCGDTHGDYDFLDTVADMAAEHDAEIIQVGDWSYVWPGVIPRTLQVKTKGVAERQLEAVSTALVRAGEKHAKPPVTMRFIDGNHDWHPKLKELCEVIRHDEFSALRVFDGGGYELAPNVIYQPRGSWHEDADGTRFLFLGGAPSIDKAFRTEGRSWWPEEYITTEERQRALDAPGPFHVMVTHDAPDFPIGFQPKGDQEHRDQQAISQEAIRACVHKHEPAMLVHGHWHHRYSTKLWNTTVIGLDCNFAKLSNAVMLWSNE